MLVSCFSTANASQNISVLNSHIENINVNQQSVNELCSDDDVICIQNASVQRPLIVYKYLGDFFEIEVVYITWSYRKCLNVIESSLGLVAPFTSTKTNVPRHNTMGNPFK